MYSAWQSTHRRPRLIALVIALAWLAAALPAYATGSSEPGELLAALRAGGLNLYFRHAATDWSQDDRVERRDDWLSCDGKQVRQLSEQGRATARDVGAAMRQLAIPVTEVLASPYCRTMETARLLGVGEVTPSTSVMNLRAAAFFGGRAAIVATARQLLASPPPGSGNRVIVAHGNVARHATPVYPDEAEAVAFRPDGEGGFEVVGRLSPAQWQTLVQTSVSEAGHKVIGNRPNREE
jgi:phosphohistidine phosphatase SixA